MTATYEQRQLKLKKLRDRKKASLAALIGYIDREIDVAVDSDAYHPAEIDQLNRARSALFAVRAGYVKRARY